MNIELNKLYPLKFKPILKQKLWGGDKIQNIYRHDEPKLETVGESWDVSAMEEDDCEVINGWLEGNTLADLTEVYMGDLVGDRVYFAGLTKKNLPRGKWRYLSEMEVTMLKMTASAFKG